MLDPVNVCSEFVRLLRTKWIVQVSSPVYDKLSSLFYRLGHARVVDRFFSEALFLEY